MSLLKVFRFKGTSFLCQEGVYTEVFKKNRKYPIEFTVKKTLQKGLVGGSSGGEGNTNENREDNVPGPPSGFRDGVTHGGQNFP